SRNKIIFYLVARMNISRDLDRESYFTNFYNTRHINRPTTCNIRRHIRHNYIKSNISYAKIDPVFPILLTAYCDQPPGEAPKSIMFIPGLNNLRCKYSSNSVNNLTSYLLLNYFSIIFNMDNKKIISILNQKLNLEQIYVTGDNNHIKIIAIGDIFKGVNQVKRQQIIYKPLIDMILEKKIHALSITTYTKEEWKKNNKNNIKI
ncbi:uncharacterized protein FWK35_00022088, partial [Aphis craccivora]